MYMIMSKALHNTIDNAEKNADAESAVRKGEVWHDVAEVLVKNSCA
jgi:hypothetical protein